MTKICFVVKSDLARDSRVMSEARMLVENFPKVDVDIINLPDRDSTVIPRKRVSVEKIHCIVRHNPVLRFFTLLEWSLRAFISVVKKKPRVLHVHDASSCIIGLTYKMIWRDGVFVVYDDHELPGSSSVAGVKVMHFFERLLLKHADAIIEANQARRDYVIRSYKLNPRKVHYLLNLPYDAYFESNKEISGERRPSQALNTIADIKSAGSKVILHQGSLDSNRCSEKIKEVIERTPSNYVVAILGPNIASYQDFCSTYDIPRDRIFFLGAVPFSELPEVWRLVDLSLIMYTDLNLNNRYCAPNRLYLSFLENKPFIYNDENPVLSRFATEYGGGIPISLVGDLADRSGEIDYKSNIKDLFVSEEKKFIQNYKAWINSCAG